MDQQKKTKSANKKRGKSMKNGKAGGNSRCLKEGPGGGEKVLELWDHARSHVVGNGSGGGVFGRGLGAITKSHRTS